jgi:hypothetical protein
MITLGTLELPEGRESKVINVRPNIRTKRSYSNNLQIFKDDITREHIEVSFDMPTCDEEYDSVISYLLSTMGTAIPYIDHRGLTKSVYISDELINYIRSKRRFVSVSLTLEVMPND